MQTQEIIDRVEELREQQTPKFVAGWNIAGYLPDSEPQEYDDFDDARDAVVEQMNERKEEMEGELDEMEDSDSDDDESLSLQSQVAELKTLIEEVEGEDEEFSVVFYGVAYWVKDEGVHLPDDEKEELEAKEEFLNSLTGYGGDLKWEGEWYPSELIEDVDFANHAQQLAEDIYTIPDGWPYTCIDWEKAAEELKMDYTCADLDGETYWYRT